MDSELLKKEFYAFGDVLFARVVKDLEGRSRCYGFVEFRNNSEFLNAFRQANGRCIKGVPVCVDAEYSRLNKHFRPMRLGGGLNQKRLTKGSRFTK